MTDLVHAVDAKTAVTFVAGVLAATIGALVVQWLRTRSEHEAWLRQQRLQAYAAFLTALDGMDRLSSQWNQMWGERGLVKVAMEHYYDGLEALSRAGGQVYLLGNHDVVVACIRAIRYWSLEVQAAHQMQDLDRLVRSLDGAEEVYNDFLRPARAEIGRPAAPLPRLVVDQLKEERNELVKKGVPKREGTPRKPA